MIYAKWDVDLADRPDLVGLDFDALGMIGCLLGYCRKYETDGFIPSEAPVFRRKSASKIIERLKRDRQLIEAPGGYYLPEYLRSNESKEDIEIARLSAKERKARWKEKNGDGTRSEHVPERVPDAFGTNSHSHSHSHSNSDLKKGEVQERETAPAKETVHGRYARHYAAGQVDAGAEEYPPPSGCLDEGALAEMTAYAKGPDGKKLKGAELDAWFRATSAEYRRAQKSGANYQAGFSPVKCLAWLKAGRPKATAPPNSIVQQAPETGRVWKVGK